MEENEDSCSKAICQPWTQRYRSFSGTTLLVANYGTHFYSEDNFRAATERFLFCVKGIGRPDDYIYYRSTTPGHDQCQHPTASTPFEDFEEYRKTITWRYSWDLFDAYNDVAARKFREFNAMALNVGAARVNVVDVYPMTVLRSDGHVSGKDCANCDVAMDCLNYSLPGPVDWWSHLLFSNLADELSFGEFVGVETNLVEATTS